MNWYVLLRKRCADILGKNIIPAVNLSVLLNYFAQDRWRVGHRTHIQTEFPSVYFHQWGYFTEFLRQANMSTILIRILQWAISKLKDGGKCQSCLSKLPGNGAMEMPSIVVQSRELPIHTGLDHTVTLVPGIPGIPSRPSMPGKP